MIKLCAFADEAASDVKGQIEALKRNNIHFIELRGLDGKNVLDLTLEEACNYHKIFEENEIAVWSIGSPIGKVDISVNFEEYLEKVEHICKIANIFNAQRVRMFSFFNAYNDKERVVGYLQRMVDVARQYGVVFCHENEKEVYGDTVVRVLELLDCVEGLKSVYDPANYVQCNENIKHSIASLYGRTEYFHIKDVIADTSELVPAGCGDSGIESLIERIEGDKILTIEPHLAVFEGYSGIDNTEMKNKFHFDSNAEAFDVAVKALKKLLIKKGYIEQGNCFINKP